MVMDENREMVACRLSSNDSDRGADDTDAAVRFSRGGVGVGIPLLNGDGSCNLLLLLSHVFGARPLRKGRPPSHSIPGTRRRRLRFWMDVLFCGIHSNSNKYWHQYWSYSACRGMPSEQIMYSNLSPHGSLKLYHFIAMVTVVMILLSQFPSFHSLRHINLASLFLSLGYTILVVGACINAAASKNAPPRDYSLESSESSRIFNAFTSISIIAAIYGNGILPEIQATLAPPATGKMLKGLIMCYIVIFLTFYSAAVSGYWVFGNKSNSNILKSLMPDEGPSLAPVWVLGLAIVFVLLQLFAIGLVYSQVAYEIMEKKSADVKQGMFSKRNLIPRIVLRSLYVIICGFFAAMLPFFGDINGVVGAIGFIPLDFVLPMLLYNMTYKPTKSSAAYWINNSIIVVFTCVGIMGAFSSIRKLVQDAAQFKLFSSDVVD
ncbi:Transmembrane amino acid transporter family protein [Perilla frutescens var. frutescens]|nr:Transmembrane amino acid transporter family protein [Perilla frutescens var. frutescens]